MAWKGTLCHSRVPFLTSNLSYPYLFLKLKGAISKAIVYNLILSRLPLDTPYISLDGHGISYSFYVKTLDYTMYILYALVNLRLPSSNASSCQVNSL